MNARECYARNFSTSAKYPVLYVYIEFDPTIPISNAYAASERFKSSAVLPHSGYGHGIVASPSSYVARHIQTYYEEGTLPEVGSRC